MTAPVRRILGAAASVALIAPLGFCVLLLARDLHARPSSRVPVVVNAAPTALTPGSEVVVRLAYGRRRYGALVITPEAGAPAELELRICAAADACVSFHGAVWNGEPLRLPVPPDFRGGDLRVSTVETHGAEVSIRRWPGGPAIEAVQGRSWALPFQRARDFARAYTGHDLLPAALGVYVLALAAVVVLGFVARAKRTDRAPASEE